MMRRQLLIEEVTRFTFARYIDCADITLRISSFSLRMKSARSQQQFLLPPPHLQHITLALSANFCAHFVLQPILARHALALTFMKYAYLFQALLISRATTRATLRTSAPASSSPAFARQLCILYA